MIMIDDTHTPHTQTQAFKKVTISEETNSEYFFSKMSHVELHVVFIPKFPIAPEGKERAIFPLDSP
jgi:hypothetical protein